MHLHPRSLFAPCAAIAALAVISSSCSTTIYAATVGNTVISQSTLVNQVREYEASPAMSGSLAIAPSASSIPTQATASLLKNDIFVALQQRYLSQHGLFVTAIEKDITREEVKSQEPAGTTSKQLNPSFLTYLVESEATSVAVEASLLHVNLTAGGLRVYYTKNSTAFSTACILDALFSTESAAQAALAAIATGTSFSQATQSAQGGSGGAAQCTSVGGLPAPVRDAILSTAPGHVGPLQTVSATNASGGTMTAYLVFEVVSIKSTPFSPSLEGTIAEAMLSAAGIANVQGKLVSLTKREALSTRIVVNPADGTLHVGTGQQLGFTVTPPPSPPAKTLPTTTAQTP